jgi:hypothetical protein
MCMYVHVLCLDRVCDFYGVEMEDEVGEICGSVETKLKKWNLESLIPVFKGRKIVFSNSCIRVNS